MVRFKTQSSLRLEGEETLKCFCVCLSVGLGAEKFNIVSNDHGRTPTGNTFLGKFGPKYQNCQFKLKFGI